MNWDRIEGNWKELKGKIKEKWRQLTDDRLNPPQATRLQPVVRRVSPVGLQPVPLSRLAGVVKRMMIFVNDP